MRNPMYLKHVEEEEENEERIAMDVECKLPLHALLNEERIALAVRK